MFLPSLVTSALATSTPNLYLDGACPGPVTVHVDHAAPGSRVALVRGAGFGSFVIPTGPCAGVDVGLAAPRLAVIGQASAAGEATWTPTLSAPACGQWLVAVDLDTCRTSAPIPVVPPLTDRWGITLDLPPFQGAHAVARDGTWVVAAADPLGGTTLVRLDDTGAVTSSVATPVAVRDLHQGPAGLVAVGAEHWDPALEGDGFSNSLAMSLTGALQPGWASRFDDLGTFHSAAIGPSGEIYMAGSMEALLDPSGAVSWTAARTHQGVVNAVTTTPDGFATAGWAFRSGAPGADATVFRVAADGTTRWGTRLIRVNDSVAIAILAVGNDTLVLLFDLVDAGMSLVRLDAAGTILWSRMYSTPSAAYLSCADIVPMWAGFALVCTTWDAAENPVDTVLVKIDPDGELQYARTYGAGRLLRGDVAGHLGAVLVGADAAGAARVIRVDANGQTGCDQPFDVISAPVVVTAAPELPGPPLVAPAVSHPTPTVITAATDRLGICR